MPVLIFIVIVVIAVIASVIKAFSESPKNKKSSETDGESDREEVPVSLPVGEPHMGETLKYVAPKYRPAPAPRTAASAADGERGFARKADTVTGGHHQSHCDVSYHEDSDEYRVEKVPVMNSVGGKSQEGCAEHYDVRFVKVDEQPEKKQLHLTDLQKVVVYGEIINNPAFRRSGIYSRGSRVGRR